MPRALSISARAMPSVLLSSESSWSSRARSSLWPSVVEGGTSSSSRGFLNGPLGRGRHTGEFNLTSEHYKRGPIIAPFVSVISHYKPFQNCRRDSNCRRDEVTSQVEVSS